MKKSRKIYMDYAASVSPNPSSMHAYGVETRKKLEQARAEVAGFLGARANEIIFTSGGTESNNLAIQGVLYAEEKQDFFRSSVLRVPPPARPFKNLVSLPHIITTNTEHPSVLETCKILEARKLAQVSVISVESNGIVDPEKIKKAIRKNTALVSIHYANNEIGTVQPIREIAKVIRHYNKNNSGKIIFHTDAVQAVNYLDMNVQRLGVDLLSVSGSKIKNPGVGILYKKKSVDLAPLYGGGDQESGIRPGTENVSGILEFAKALQISEKMKEKEVKRLIKLRNYFIAKLHKIFSSRFIINGDLENRLPNNINITIPNIPSDLLVIELSARGIMASAKSACKSGDEKASYVIKAINPKIKDTDGSLRFSLGKDTAKSDIDYTVRALAEILTKLKKWY